MKKSTVLIIVLCVLVCVFVGYLAASERAERYEQSVSNSENTEVVSYLLNFQA